MILLGMKGVASPHLRGVVLGKVTTVPVDPEQRHNFILVASSLPQEDLVGYAGALTTDTLSAEGLAFQALPLIHGLAGLDHLTDGDVVALNPDGYARTLYRIQSQHNALFATDRCNSLCLMCSQPPKDIDDSARIHEHLRLVELIDPNTQFLGITGGEPTLLKDDLLKIIERCKDLLPTTALHILSNGRLFYYRRFADRIAEIGHPNLVFGIPLYSDIDSLHDHVVQSRGAFEETVIGLHNLALVGVRVEIRVVIHSLTFQRLPQLAQFIYRNLPFTSHVALMGLEMMGFAVPNADALWIDPWDYREELARSVLFLSDSGMSVSIYNHQLCTVPRSLWPYCRKSISDWKNEFLPICADCGVRESCGGLFTSSMMRRHSTHIQPLTVDDPSG